MNAFAKVENERDLVRDVNSKAILNTNLAAREAFLRDREKAALFENLLTSNLSAMETIKSEVIEIKAMLREISTMKCKR